MSALGGEAEIDQACARPDWIRGKRARRCGRLRRSCSQTETLAQTEGAGFELMVCLQDVSNLGLRNQIRVMF